MSAADTVYRKLKSAPPSMVEEVLNFVDILEARAKAKAPAPTSAPGWDAIFGRLRDEPIAEGDPAELQSKLRDEWA